MKKGVHFVGSNYVCRFFSRCLCNISPQETNACPHFLTCVFHTDWMCSIPTPSVYRKIHIKMASKRVYLWLFRRIYGNSLGWKWAVDTAVTHLSSSTVMDAYALCIEEVCTSQNLPQEFGVDCVWNVMAHAQKPDFVFRRNGRVHLNRRGRQFSRVLAAEVRASAVVMLDTPCSEVVWRVLATHSICQFPFHFPSRASPCAITFQLDSNCLVITDGFDTASIWSPSL